MALAGLGVHLWLCNRGSHVQSFKMTSFRARQPLFSPADMMNVKYISEKLEEIQEIKNNLIYRYWPQTLNCIRAQVKLCFAIAIVTFLILHFYSLSFSAHTY